MTVPLGKHARIPRLRRGFLREVLDGFVADDCMLIGAAISFYCLLAVIPLAFLSVAFLGYLVGSAQGALEHLIGVLHEFLPEVTVERIEGALRSLIAKSGVASIIGIAALLWVANGVFETIERAVNIIFKTQENRGVLYRKLVGLVMMATTGALVLLSFLVSPLMLAVWQLLIQALDYLRIPTTIPVMIVSRILDLWNYVTILIPFFLMVVVFLVIYLLAPAQAIAIPSALTGAVFAALLWLLAKEGYSFYLLHYARYDQLYGPMAAIIGFVLWVYYSAMILLLGAEVAEVHYRRRFVDFGEREATALEAAESRR